MADDGHLLCDSCTNVNTLKPGGGGVVALPVKSHIRGRHNANDELSRWHSALPDRIGRQTYTYMVLMREAEIYFETTAWRGQLHATVVVCWASYLRYSHISAIP